MSNAAAAASTKNQPPAPPAAPPATPKPTKAPDVQLLVLDTTAINEPRTHEQVVDGVIRPFVFERGKPLPLPFAIASKFLVHEAFKLMNEKGEIIAWKRHPKQPDELGAGEKIKVGDDETIARYDELSNNALLQRAVVMPGGEKFAQGKDRPDRGAMISFITEATKLKRRAMLSAEKDIGDGEFTPEAEADDDMSDA